MEVSEVQNYSSGISGLELHIVQVPVVQDYSGDGVQNCSSGNMGS